MRRLLPCLAFLAVLAACHRPVPLTAPTPAGLDAIGPDSFTVRFTTTRGAFDLKVHRDWSPRGADRIHWLVNHRYYDGVRFFRVVPNFVVQFGMNGDPAVQRAWKDRRFADDTVKRGNVRGTLSFATGGPNTRTTQLFINLKNNQRLDPLGFSVVAQVVAGMGVVDSLYQGYGDGPPRGKGPSQDAIAKEGEAYLAREFPKLDKVLTARVIRRWR
ncbi:MAG TPA: peptidylprolyl isomerase [Gemmatimonadaceae bacterium]|jgi:peptidyl-prolyl cis-trans isomerase A (cyclophilin A)